MRGTHPAANFRGLKVSIAVLLVLLAVAPFCSASPQRSIHRHLTVRQATGTSRDIAEVSPDLVVAPPPRCGALERPASIGWLTPAGEPVYLPPLGFPSLQSRAPPVR